MTKLVSLRLFNFGSFPQGVSHGISFHARRSRHPGDSLPWPRWRVSTPWPGPKGSWPWRLGFLGLIPFLSINRPAEQPFEALAPLLVSYLSFSLAVAGLLVSAGLINRHRKRPARLEEPASAEILDRQSGSPEVSRALAQRQPAAGCRFMLAGSGTLPRPGITAIPLREVHPISAHHTRLGDFVKSHAELFTPGDGTLGLRVLRFGGPARSGSITRASRRSSCFWASGGSATLHCSM